MDFANITKLTNCGLAQYNHSYQMRQRRLHEPKRQV